MPELRAVLHGGEYGRCKTEEGSPGGDTLVLRRSCREVGWCAKDKIEGDDSADGSERVSAVRVHVSIMKSGRTGGRR